MTSTFRIGTLTWPAKVAPPLVGGLVAWYDATQVTGLADGQSFGLWQNEVALGSTWQLLGAGTPAPVYYSTTSAKLINGLPAVWFAGGDVESTPNAKSVQGADGSWTMFAVGYNTGSGTQNLFEQISSIQFIQTNGTSLQSIDNGHTATQAGASTTRANLFTVVCDTTSIRPRLNRVAGTAVATGSLITFGGVLVMGGGGTNYWNGPICEVIGYNRALTDPEIALIESYAQNKWATP